MAFVVYPDPNSATRHLVYHQISWTELDKSGSITYRTYCGIDVPMPALFESATGMAGCCKRCIVSLKFDDAT